MKFIRFVIIFDIISNTGGVVPLSSVPVSVWDFLFYRDLNPPDSYRRVDASLPLLEMLSFDKDSSVSIKKAEVSIAKNYENEDEMKLRRI